jgi:hypothetical protein
MWRPSVFLILLVHVMLIGGCSEDDTPPPITKKPAPLVEVPVEMFVKQRTTSAVPGSDGKLFLTIDDITDGQVMVSIATDGGTAILPLRSLKNKESAGFKFESVYYELTLRQLDNALVGDDTATLVIGVPTEGDISESDKIERLISEIEHLKDAKFIRNGSEYSAADAAELLRSKLEAAGNEILTAEHFIEHVGSKSSTSGESYQIKFSDGTVVNAGDFLRLQLNEIK